MKEKLRSKIQQMMMGVRLPGHDLSQFTLDWLEDLDEGSADEIRPGDNDGALCYEIDNICQVLKNGADKDFFVMIRIYAKLYTN